MGRGDSERARTRAMAGKIKFYVPLFRLFANAIEGAWKYLLFHFLLFSHSFARSFVSFVHSLALSLFEYSMHKWMAKAFANILIQLFALMYVFTMRWSTTTTSNNSSFRCSCCCCSGAN